jgi:predicted MFS family arabinose efflux permease
VIRLPHPAFPPKLGRDAWLVNASLMVFAAAFLGITQLLRVIYLLRLGAGLELIGLLYGIGALLFGVLGLPSGALGERVGARHAMLFGAGVLVLGLCLLPVTELLTGPVRAIWPIVPELVNTLGWSLLVVNSVPILVATTAPEDRKTAYALREALLGFANLSGMLLAGVLPATFAFLLGTTTATPAPYRFGLLSSVVLGAGGLFVLTRTGPLRYERHASTASSASAPWRPIVLLLICGFLNQGAVASCRAFTYAYMDTAFGMPTSVIGLISAIGMALAVVAALNSSRLARRHGSGKAMALASVALALDLLMMALIPHWIAAAAGTIGVLALFSLWMPAYQTLQMEFAAPGQRAMVSGAGFMALGLGFGITSLIGGRLAATAGYSALFLFGVALALSSAGLMLYVHKLRVRQDAAVDRRHEQSIGRPTATPLEPETRPVGG